jgi:hypothetical protein
MGSKKYPYEEYVDSEAQYEEGCYVSCRKNLGDFCGCLRTWIPCVFCLCVEYPY